MKIIDRHLSRRKALTGDNVGHAKRCAVIRAKHQFALFQKSLSATRVWIGLSSALERDLILRNLAALVDGLRLSPRIVSWFRGGLRCLPNIDSMNVIDWGDHVGLLCRGSADWSRTLARSGNL